MLLATTNFVEAQSNWRFEVKSGLAYATKDLGDADINSGFGFEGIFLYKIMPHLNIYAGWGWNHFNSEKSSMGDDLSFEETGYRIGLKFTHPIGNSRFNYILNGGAVYNHIEVENTKGDIIDDSGHGLGWQIGTGLMIPVTEILSLSPTISYNSLSRDIEVENRKTEVDYNYLSFSVGLSWSL